MIVTNYFPFLSLTKATYLLSCIINKSVVPSPTHFHKPTAHNIIMPPRIKRTAPDVAAKAKGRQQGKEKGAVTKQRTTLPEEDPVEDPGQLKSPPKLIVPQGGSSSFPVAAGGLVDTSRQAEIRSSTTAVAASAFSCSSPETSKKAFRLLLSHHRKHYPMTHRPVKATDDSSGDDEDDANDDVVDRDYIQPVEESEGIVEVFVVDVEFDITYDLYNNKTGEDVEDLTYF